MIDFLTLSEDDNLTSAVGNRHTVVGYTHSFSEADLNSNNLTDDALPAGCYVIYDSFGGRVTGNECPAGGCECTVRVVNDEC